MKMSEVNYENLSPMMKQYYDIKKNYEGILLFYRLGDFYEMFYDDAILVARELEITLTRKRLWTRRKGTYGRCTASCGRNVYSKTCK